MSPPGHEGGSGSTTGWLAVLDRGTPSGTEPTLVEASVIEHHEAAERHWFLRIHAPSIATSAQPGQFLMLTVARRNEPGPVLPRPMAIYGWDLDQGVVDVVYRVVGSGTWHLTTFRPGERITTVGPLGRGFIVNDSTRRILLVGRGIGTCSLTALAARASENHISIDVVESARHSGALIGDMAYQRANVDRLFQVTDRDGSSDPQTVLERLVGDLNGDPPQQIFVCGSQRLTAMSAALGERWDAEVQVSVEARMACGIGYCHGCSTGQRTAEAEAPLVCRDGPVFRWTAQLGNGGGSSN